ncbi:sigma factor serine-protein kinase family protein [delta proteobacterium NaphS2]|nr:sigma factor serine-protein kinase family protein [delta proteobacterium NaphS2]
MAKIELPARMEQLETMLDFIDKEADAAEFPKARVSKIRLAAEEVLVNVFSYAYPEKQGQVTIICLHKNDRFLLEIQDRGIPFNMLKAPDPDISSGLSERHLGGLGIYFAKQMADEARYVRTEGVNRLTLVFKKNGQKLS